MSAVLSERRTENFSACAASSGAETQDTPSKAKVYFPWEAEKYDFLKTPLCSLVEKTKPTPALTITGRYLHSGSTDLDLRGTAFI